MDDGVLSLAARLGERRRPVPLVRLIVTPPLPLEGGVRLTANGAACGAAAAVPLRTGGGASAGASRLPFLYLK